MSEPDQPQQDPFAAFDAERTIIKPTGAAGRRQAGGAPAPAAPAPVSPAAPLPELPPGAGLNPLVQAAAALLAIAPRLRAMPRHPNPQALRESLVASIQHFESQARAQGLPNEQVIAARYVLCTVLDESASSTPWGGAGAWTSHSLLVQFHNESWGGEKVFQLLTRLAENPAQHRNLLELVYVALSLGFEGRYRVLDQGRAQLDSLRERLAQMLRQQAPPAEPTLSVHWQGRSDQAARLRDGIAPWMVAVGALILLTLAYLGFSWSLNASTDPVFGALQGLHVKVPATPQAPATPPAPVPPRLASLLKADIDAGLVQVQDLPDRSIVTILGDTLFDPGSAELASRALPLFEHVAQALNQLPGRVLVSGHTDNQPIRSLRFPSNWHLSKARAANVHVLLARTVAAGRLSDEGEADARPVADNATADGRARNRRVEVTLFVAAAQN